MSFLKKLWIFIKRGFITNFSYRTYAILGIASMLIGVLRFGFMANFLQQGNTFPMLEPYGGDLMAFLITGTMYMSYVSVALDSFRNSIRSEQSMGTLEYLLMSNTPLWQLLIFNGINSFIWTTINVGVIFLFLVLIFDIQMTINIILSLFILILSIICISGIGLMSAGVIMVTKMGDPISWIFSTLSGLVSGVLYPISILPAWLRSFSYFLPPTYALSALRKSLLTGATFMDVKNEIIILIIMSLLTIPLGLLVFRLGFNKARETGSLIEY